MIDTGFLDIEHPVLRWAPLSGDPAAVQAECSRDPSSAEHISEQERLSREGRLGPPPPFMELPSSSRGVRLQLSALQIMNGLGGFLGRPTAAGIYVITTVTDGIGEQPITFQGKVYQGIRHGDLLPLDPAHEQTCLHNDRGVTGSPSTTSVDESVTRK